MDFVSDFLAIASANVIDVHRTSITSKAIILYYCFTFFAIVGCIIYKDLKSKGYI